MHFDDGRTGIEVEVPDVLQQHRARDDLSLMLHEILKEPVLARLQFDKPSPARDDTTGLVELEIANFQRPAKQRCARTPAERSDTRNEFREGGA
jgi:hypothetical protein